LEIVSNPTATILQGQRNSSLFALGARMRERGITIGVIRSALLDENQTRCIPPLSESEVACITKSLEQYPLGRPFNRKTYRADVLCLADVQPEPIVWLWEPYIPLKMITILSGDPGVGKTYLALALSSALTRGEAFGTTALAEPSAVLYLTNENSPSHVLRPRFDVLRGDASRFFIVQGTIASDGATANITLSDTQQLEEVIVTKNIRLVVIDPLQSFLGSAVDAHRANQTRPLMDGLIRLAERTGCAILIARHLSKGIGGSALHRGMGSIDFTGAARSELFVAPHPEEGGRVVMAHSKSNLGKFGPSLVYSIDDKGVLTWHGECSFKANDLLSAPPTVEERSAVEEAEDFLRQILADGPKPAKDVQSKAEENGISEATLRRARRQLQIQRAPQGFKGPWMLSLPTVAQESSELLISSP
jgi:hypothetical protein